MTGTAPEQARVIKIKWQKLGIRVTALMTVVENSHLIDLLFKNLPYRALQSHALVSGDHLYHIIPAEEFTERSCLNLIRVIQYSHRLVLVHVCNPYCPKHG